MRLPRVINVRLLEPKKRTSNKKYISIFLSGLLVVSESLPFVESFKANGILDAIRMVNDELRKA